MYSESTQVYGISPKDLKSLIVETVEDILSSFFPETKEKQEVQDDLLTRNEASKFLKVSKATLNNWANAGIIQKRKIGNVVRYSKAELLEAVKKQSANKSYRDYDRHKLLERRFEDPVYSTRYF